MNTKETDNQNDNSSTALHTYDNSAPSVSPELLAETVYSMIRYKPLPREVIELLSNEAMAGKETASFCILSDELSRQLPDHVVKQVVCNLKASIKEKHPFGLYVNGCSLIRDASRHKIERGVELLNMVAESGIEEGYWTLALYYANQGIPEALKYGLLALEAGWPPAIQADKYARFMCENSELKNRKSLNETRLFLSRENSNLELQIETLKTKFRAEKADLNTQVMNWQKRCEDAESRLASWSAEAFNDEHILKLQSSTKKAEEDWLEAKCAQETAEAKQINAETVADDLTRRNKRLAGLLRKNHIAFNEHESSSSSENGEPHLGLAS